MANGITSVQGANQSVQTNDEPGHDCSSNITEADKNTFERTMNGTIDIETSQSPVTHLDEFSRGLSISGGPPVQGDVWDGIKTITNLGAKFYSGVIKPVARKAFIMPSFLRGPFGPVIINK